MAELINPPPWNSGYMPETEGIRLELYRLLNQFLASDAVSNLCEEDERLYEAMSHLDNFFEAEATRILLSAAVVARVIDDRYDQLKNYDTNCGTLIVDLESPEEIDLNLRAACNKIIHAKTIRYDVEFKSKDQRYLNPYVYYYGEKGGKEWKATLNIVDFIKKYTLNVVC